MVLPGVEDQRPARRPMVSEPVASRRHASISYLHELFRTSGSELSSRQFPFFALLGSAAILACTGDSLGRVGAGVGLAMRQRLRRAFDLLLHAAAPGAQCSTSRLHGDALACSLFRGRADGPQDAAILEMDSQRVCGNRSTPAADTRGGDTTAVSGPRHSLLRSPRSTHA